MRCVASISNFTYWAKAILKRVYCPSAFLENVPERDMSCRRLPDVSKFSFKALMPLL